MEEIRVIPPEDLIYLDESGMEDTLHRDYAWSPRGEQVWDDISGKRKQRISLIAGLQGKEFQAPLQFEGYCNTELFNDWLEKCLMPILPFGKTLVLDNASFHKSVKTRQLIESKGCSLKYLPAYSPDLNPIENHWAILKARIKKHRHHHSSLNETIESIFKHYD